MTEVLTFSIRIVFVTLIGLLVYRLARKTSAATQHFILLSTLVAVWLLPLASISLPKHTLPPIVADHTVQAIILRPLSPVSTLVAPISAPIPQNVVWPRYSVADVLIAVWAAVALILLIRLFLGWRKLAQIVLRATPLPDLGPNIYRSDEVPVPLTCWHGRHYVILRTEDLHGDPERLQRVICHEQAHVTRGDWFVQMFGALTAAIGWFNPFLWILVRTQRAVAEAATDDLVLMGGTRASEYAADLLSYATAGSLAPRSALPIARQSEVHRRIEYMLATRNRGAVTLPLVIVSALAIVGVGVPLATLVIQNDKDYPGRSTSFYQDIRSGKTTPARESNHWEGILADGTHVRLVQIAERINGKVIAWRPDGSLIPATELIPVSRWAGKGKYEITTEVPNPGGGIKVDGGMGSGPALPGEPDRLTFAGGYLGEDASKNVTYIRGFLEVPNLANGHGTVGFTYQTGPTETRTLSLAKLKPQSLYGGTIVSQSPPNQKHETRIALDLPDNFGFWFDIAVVGPDGKATAYTTNEGEYTARRYRGIYHYALAPTDPTIVKFQKRDSYAVDLLSFALKPKTP